MPSVLQPWVQDLTYMQQGVLVSSVRGPDGMRKDHIAKLLIRWLRRCTLHMAFESAESGNPVAFVNPRKPGGGSFTGPSLPPFAHQTNFDDCFNWEEPMMKVLDQYLSTLDEVPHHFQLHFMHASEIIGYKHPDVSIRDWWIKVYYRLANDMHLNPESGKQMDFRLGDKMKDWADCEEVQAKAPGSPEAESKR